MPFSEPETHPDLLMKHKQALAIPETFSSLETSIYMGVLPEQACAMLLQDIFFPKKGFMDLQR